jgi:hypothetical protein
MLNGFCIITICSKEKWVSTNFLPLFCFWYHFYSSLTSRKHRLVSIKCTIIVLTLILLMWRIGQAPNSIPIYIQQEATLHSLFISGNCTTCFGWYFHPSSGAHTTDGWKYHPKPKHVEQFTDINKLCNVASCWIYTRIFLRCTDP